MTTREKAALTLLTVAVLALSAAGYGWGGWPAAAAVLGVLTLTGGVVLAYDPNPVAAPVPEEAEPGDDFDQLDDELDEAAEEPRAPFTPQVVFEMDNPNPQRPRPDDVDDGGELPATGSDR